MQYVIILILAALTLGLCYLFDKGFTKAFRSKPQHRSGRAVRVNKKYGAAGIILLVLGLASLMNGFGQTKIFLVAAIVLIPTGICFIIYYMSFGIYYDDDSFLYCVPGRKSVTYEYGQILSQQLYNASGNIVIELHLDNEASISLQAGMPGVYEFLEEAFAGWCRQTEHEPSQCSFYHPEETCFFPPVEEL